MKTKTIIYKTNLYNKIDLQTIFANNGATLDKDGNKKEYKKGYQVSVCDLYQTKTTKANKIKKQTIKAITKANANYNIGLWIDKNIMYIDYSINIQNKQDAIKIAKIYKQKSIYNWQKQKCISIKY